MYKNEVKEAIFEAFEYVTLKNFVKIELLKAINEDRWITIHPHGDDSEDYRRLKLKDGETPKEAMHRMGWYEKRKAKDEQKSRFTKYLDKFEELEDQSDKEKLDEYLEKSSDEILKIDIDSLNNKELQEAERYIKKSENYYIHYLTREKLVKIKQKIQEKLESKGYQKTKKELTEVAGVKKGKPMTHHEADNGNVNPNYMPNSAYSKNCQSCVVCYELRRRGFNLKTKPRVNKGYMQDLALDATLAYIDPKTGRKPEKNIMKVTTPDKAYDWLQDNINDGRYEFRVVWKKSGYGHIITAYKENGNVVLYDPQNNKTYKTKDEMKDSILNKVKFKGYESTKPFALRVDNLDINQEILDAIVERF